MTEQIERIETKKLTIHPLADRLPMLTPENDQFTELVRSVGELGVLHPLVVDEQNQVIAGRHRLEAARATSQETVPVIRLTVTGPELAEIIMAENVERQRMSGGKRALMVVAYHEEFFKGRKARQKATQLRGSVSRRSECNHREFPNEIAIPENPFCGDKYGLVHAEKWRAMPMTVKQMAARYRVRPEDLAWAAHLYDAKEDPAAWKHIQGVFDDRESLGAAYAGFMGGKAPQKKHSSNSRMIGWIDGMRKNVKSMYKVQNESKETFEKHRDDLLAIYNDLRVLLDIPCEKTNRHIKG